MRTSHFASTAGFHNLSLSLSQQCLNLKRNVLRVLRQVEVVLARNFGRALGVTLIASLLATSAPTAAPTLVSFAKEAERIVVWRSHDSRVFSALRRGLAHGSGHYWSLNNKLASKTTAEHEKSPQHAAIVAAVSPAPLVIDAPTNLTVTATANNSISLSWTAPSGTVDNYQIERSPGIASPFSSVGTSPGTSFNDATVSSNNAYLYRVRAVSGGIPSSPSNMAVGTAITYTDNPLSAGVTTVKAVHITELRQSVNAVRSVAGLSAASWTDTSLPGIAIKAVHVQEMRDKLGEALTALSVSTTAYTDPVLATGTNGTPVKKVHIEELRLRASRGSSASSGSTGGDLATARLDPLNRTGGGGEDPLSRNFNWSIPLVSLPGRAGLDPGISLSYNSLVWTKAGSTISFDDDRGFPSPGFRLGFPVIQPQYFNSEVGKLAYLLITPSGSRVELRQVGISSRYESADSSHMLLETNTTPMVLKTTDGTQLSYEWKGSELQCTKIKDRNGNFITVNYTAFNRIDTVVDTLSRTIKFNYDGSQSLTSITQTWTVNGSPMNHTWASFAYSTPNLTIQTNFPGLTVIGPQNGSTIKVLKQVTVNDGSRFDFDYTSWGQVWKISNFAPAPNQLHLRNYRSYNLPQNNSIAHSDCPRFTERRDLAANWNRSGPNGAANLPVGAEQEVLTSFAVPVSATWTMPDNSQQTGMRAEVTMAANFASVKTSQKIHYEGTAGTSIGWKRGLPSLVETFDSANVRQKQSVTTWTQDNTAVSFPLNPRVIETNVYDPAGNRARTVIDYLTANHPDGTSCRLPKDVFEYQANATTVLRRTHNEYNLNSTYTDRRIIGLVSEKTLYQVDPVTQAETLMSKVAFGYDGTGSLVGNDTPVQHDNTAYSASFVDGRANLSNVKRYDVVTSLFVTSSSKYNTAGAVVQSTDPAGHVVNISYADAFAANGTTLDPALGFSTLAYPSTVTDADGDTFSARYNYDFGAATWKQTPLPNTTVNTPGPQQKFIYDDKGRLERVTNLVNNAYSRFIYGPNFVENFASVNNVADEAHTLQIFDGLGRTIANASNHPGSMGGFSGQLFLYDAMGRAIKQSNPTETSITISGVLQPYNWSATGDDATPAGFGWIYTQQTYDWKGRPLVTTNTDTTTREASYTGCGCAGGEVVTLTDEGTIDGGVPKRRQQKIYSDILGRTVKTEILNWQGGSVYSTTVNTYNARDQVTLIRQFQGTAPVDPNDLSCPTGTCQQTTMTYDGHGRLQTRHIPEQNAGTNMVWAYNSDDTIQMITDARGASQTMTYNGRHLVTGVTYAAPAPIPTPSPVTYVYDAAGNRTSMSDSTGTTTHLYDTLSRMTSETRTFQDIPIPGSFTLTYNYNLAGQLTSLTDGFTGQVNYQYDNAGRLFSVGSSGYTASYFNFSTQQLVTQPVSQLISEIEYRAWGSAKQMTFGNGVFETANYNARLRPTSYSLNNVRLQCLAGLTCSIPSATMSWTYDYYADGRLNHAFDSENIKFDRRQEFDHVGRYKEGYTNREARGLPFDFNEPDPYRHTVQYDVWGNITSRTGRLWSSGQVDTATYTNHRRQSWSYDANGNLIGDNSKAHTYNAVNQQTYVRSLAIVGDGTPSFPVNPQMEITQSYDGLGAVARRTQITREEVFEEEVLTNIFVSGQDLAYLRATPLGGVVVAELNIFQTQGSQPQAEKKQINIYAKGQRIAREESEAIKYEAHNPQTGSWVSVHGHSDDRFASREERDPFNADLPLTDPDPSVTYTGGSDGQLYIHGGDPWDLSGGCDLDGMPIPCSDLAQRMRIGAVSQEITLTDGTVIQLPPPQDFGLGVFLLFRPDPLARVTKEDLPPVLDTNDLQGFWNAFWNALGGFDFLFQARGSSNPQKDTFDVPGITQLVNQELADPDCAKFVETILNQLSGGKGGNLANVFTAFLNQPQPHALFTRVRPSGSRGEATALGKLKNSTASMFLRRATPETQLVTDADNVLQESFHFAGNEYSDEDLAKALRNTTYAQDASRVFPDGTANIFDKRYIPAGWSDADGYSTYFHAIARLYCGLRPPNTYKNLKK